MVNFSKKIYIKMVHLFTHTAFGISFHGGTSNKNINEILPQQDCNLE